MNLLYVADPMCSWCYGFGASLDALLREPGPAAPLQLAMVMGGLRPYTTEPVAPHFAQEILGHWKHVEAASGQPFCQPPDTPLNDPGFVYDTEPASRATIAVRTHWPRLVWRYFKTVQTAFYAVGRDITRPEILADAAESLGIPRQDFAVVFALDALREATRNDFQQAQDWGIRGFPAVIAEHAGEYHLVAQGYLSVDALRERLQTLLTRH